MKNKIAFFVCLLFILNSCQSLKDGLTGSKRENSDEFLVEKKNPLEIPPEYGNLPEPKDVNQQDVAETVDEEIEDLIEKISNDQTNTSTSNKSAEEFVLKEINKN